MSGRVVGQVVGKVAEKLEQTADALHLPVPKTRKSRVLVRSVIVGFLVVAAWIVGLVWWQLRGASKPDLRPTAQHIMEQLAAGNFDKVYAEASPRYQEIVPEGSFAVQMADMNASLGPFKEITSVTGTEVVVGASGTSARIALVMTFEKATKVRGSLSFHREDRQWRLLGVSIDLPADLAKVESAEAKREDRVKGDPVVRVDALVVLLRLERGDVRGVWSDAAPVFQGAVSIDDLTALEKQRQKEIGRFDKIVDVTSNRKNPSGTGDSLDLVVQYKNAAKAAEPTIISAHFEFTRDDPRLPVWKLSTYKPIMPLPRVPAK